LHRQHGRSYFLATRLLPPWKRQHVHALYGFTRYTDDLVDAFDDDGIGPASVAQRAARLDAWEMRFRAGLDDPDAVRDDPILPAVLHTMAVFDLDDADFDSFLRSMRMDLEVREYRDYPALLDYMEGSAAVIGTMMLPILLAEKDGTEPPGLRAATRESARQLGFAFQLTNFIRDVAEDFRRGRIYLPRQDLEDFSVRPDDLALPSAPLALRRLIAFETQRAAEHYERARAGIELLPPRSARCIQVAHDVYGGILAEVARADYDVLVRRARVPARRKAVAVLRAAGRRR